MTSSLDILNYLQVEWNIADPAVADILFSHEWFDWKDQRHFQLVVSPLWSTRQQTWNTAGSYPMRANNVFAVDIAYMIPRGAIGTLEAQTVENARKEIAQIMRLGLGYSPKYGGSLSPIRVAIPDGFGKKLNEMDRTPRILRTQILLRCTEDM